MGSCQSVGGRCRGGFVGCCRVTAGATCVRVDRALRERRLRTQNPATFGSYEFDCRPGYSLTWAWSPTHTQSAVIASSSLAIVDVSNLVGGSNTWSSLVREAMR